MIIQVAMGRPKKWYLGGENGVSPEIFLFNCDNSRMTLLDSDELLGRVLDVTMPKKGKYPSEGVIVSIYINLTIDTYLMLDSHFTPRRYARLQLPLHYTELSRVDNGL